MQAAVSFLNEHAGVIAALACVGCVALLLWVGALSGRVRSVTPDMRRLVRELEGMDARQMFETHLAHMHHAITKAAEVEQIAGELALRQKYSLQKVGLVRFNSEPNLGGDLSFALALLNDENDGMILTSIYNLEECRTYVKPVQSGACDIPTSTEERRALEIALKR